MSNNNQYYTKNSIYNYFSYVVWSIFVNKCMLYVIGWLAVYRAYTGNFLLDIVTNFQS